MCVRLEESSAIAVGNLVVCHCNLPSTAADCSERVIAFAFEGSTSALPACSVTSGALVQVVLLYRSDCAGTLMHARPVMMLIRDKSIINEHTYINVNAATCPRRVHSVTFRLPAQALAKVDTKLN